MLLIKLKCTKCVAAFEIMPPVPPF